MNHTIIVLVISIMILMASVQASNIQLQHLTIDTTTTSNLLPQILDLKTKQNQVRALTKNANCQSVQLMIQFKDHSAMLELEKLLGKNVDNIIPPNTIVIHENVDML